MEKMSVYDLLNEWEMIGEEFSVVVTNDKIRGKLGIKINGQDYTYDLDEPVKEQALKLLQYNKGRALSYLTKNNKGYGKYSLEGYQEGRKVYNKLVENKNEVLKIVMDNLGYWKDIVNDNIKDYTSEQFGDWLAEKIAEEEGNSLSKSDYLSIANLLLDKLKIKVESKIERFLRK